MAGCCIYAEYPAKNRKRKTCVNMALQNKKKSAGALFLEENLHMIFKS